LGLFEDSLRHLLLLVWRIAVFAQDALDHDAEKGTDIPPDRTHSEPIQAPAFILGHNFRENVNGQSSHYFSPLGFCMAGAPVGPDGLGITFGTDPAFGASAGLPRPGVRWSRAKFPVKVKRR
jgi:hypothetical protein